MVDFATISEIVLSPSVWMKMEAAYNKYGDAYFAEPGFIADVASTILRDCIDPMKKLVYQRAQKSDLSEKEIERHIYSILYRDIFPFFRLLPWQIEHLLQQQYSSTAQTAYTN